MKRQLCLPRDASVLDARPSREGQRSQGHLCLGERRLAPPQAGEPRILVRLHWRAVARGPARLLQPGLGAANIDEPTL